MYSKGEVVQDPYISLLVTMAMLVSQRSLATPMSLAWAAGTRSKQST